MAYQPARAEFDAFDRFSEPYQYWVEGKSGRNRPWAVNALAKDGGIIKKKLTCKRCTTGKKANEYARRVLLPQWQRRPVPEDAPKTLGQAMWMHGQVMPYANEAEERANDGPYLAWMKERYELHDIERGSLTVARHMARKHLAKLAHVPLDALIDHDPRTAAPPLKLEIVRGPLQDYLIEVRSPEYKPKPVSGDTAGNILAATQHVLSFCYEQGWLPVGNYLIGRRYKGVEDKVREQAPPPALVNAVLIRADQPMPEDLDAECQATWDGTALAAHIKARTGARISQVLGLKVPMIDFVRMEIDFKEQYQRDPDHPERSQREAKGRRRSTRKRSYVVPMDKDLATRILAHLRKRGLDATHTGYLIVGNNGQPLSRGNVTSKYWARLFYYTEPIGTFAQRIHMKSGGFWYKLRIRRTRSATSPPRSR